MKFSLIKFMVFFSLMKTAQSNVQCEVGDWTKSFDTAGVVQCNRGDLFITGFYRNYDGKYHEDIRTLEMGWCCTAPGLWAFKRETMTYFADWLKVLDNNYNWATCPAGYFLSGLYRSNEKKNRIHNIEHGQCSKPAEHPNYHGACIKHNVAECMKRTGWCKCPSGYYVAGIRRGGCDDLDCLDYLMCCQMADKPEVLRELIQVKSRVMDITLTEMAFLADSLGFAWPQGCRARSPGQDFRRISTTWQAEAKTSCKGTKSGERLQIAYEDWAFETASITYGKATITDLAPESIDMGEVQNDNEADLIHYTRREIEVARSVTHVIGQQFKKSNEFSVSLKYEAGMQTTVGVGGSFTFGWESGTKREDSKGETDKKKFSVAIYYFIKPSSALRWSIMLLKTQAAVTYNATIQVKFAASFKSFLRTGDLKTPKLNYHKDFRYQGSNPSFSYKFGDSNKPVFEALEEESYYSSLPWLWMDLRTHDEKVDGVIKRLSDKNRFTFGLSGKFYDITGTSTKVVFDAIPLKKGFDLKRDLRVARNGQVTTNGASQVYISQPDPSNPNYRTVEVLTAPNPEVFNN